MTSFLLLLLCILSPSFHSATIYVHLFRREHRARTLETESTAHKHSFVSTVTINEIIDTKDIYIHIMRNSCSIHHRELGPNSMEPILNGDECVCVCSLGEFTTVYIGIDDDDHFNNGTITREQRRKRQKLENHTIHIEF